MRFVQQCMRVFEFMYVRVFFSSILSHSEPNHVIKVWVQLFKWDETQYFPLLQSKDDEHIESENINLENGLICFVFFFFLPILLSPALTHCVKRVECYDGVHVFGSEFDQIERTKCTLDRTNPTEPNPSSKSQLELLIFVAKEHNDL